MKVSNDILIPELARLIAEGKEVRFTPSGVSMRPFIEGDRDAVILAPLNRAPRVGDILLACVTNHQSPITNHQSSPTYVLHRLIRIETIHQTSDIRHPLYILQGDGNLSGEEQCTRGDIIALVKRIETPSGHRKPLTRGRLWYAFKPLRKWLLKIYRHTILKTYN